MAKVLLITHVQPPAVDGGSRVICKIGEYLHKLGHKTLLVSSNGYSTDDFTNSPKKYNSTGLPFYTIFHKPFKLISRLLPVFNVFAKGPIFKFIPFFQLMVTSYRFHPDLIIAGPLPTTIVLYARLIQFFTKSKLLIIPCFHETDSDFKNILLLNTLKSADYLWTLTNFETKYFKDYKTLNLGSGINPSLLKKTQKVFPKNPTIICLGALAKHKNIEELISTHQQLLPKFPNLKLIITGQKTLYYPQLKKFLSQKNITTIFSFKDRDLKKLIDSATILVSPSTQESFGLTLIEAWARKTPVVVNNIPSSSELVTKSNGGLIGLENIEKLLTDQALCQKLGQNGYNYVTDHYLWPDIAKNLCQKLF